MSDDDVVITGLGVVSPLGVGNEAFWASLLAARSGVRPLSSFDASSMPANFGGEVVDFDPKEYVRPRKSLKVMSREIQFGVTAAGMAMEDAHLAAEDVDPERMGVVFAADLMQCPLDDFEAAYRACVVDGRFDFSRWGEQAFQHIYPLWMLKYLPNMPACHIAITHDARGPNNTHTLGEVSSLTAIAEACRAIERGQADVMVAGGASTRVHPTTWVRNNIGQVSRRGESPEQACRPFDADRDGAVHGEGAAAMILERGSHARRRGAKVMARVLGFASGFEARANGSPLKGTAVRGSIRNALAMAQLEPRDVGHVNAHGLSTTLDDRMEAHAIHDLLGDVHVTAPKSFFGNLGAGGGAVELAASLLGLGNSTIPMTLNYHQRDPECAVNVVHDEPLQSTARVVLALNQSTAGQAASLVIAAE